MKFFFSLLFVCTVLTVQAQKRSQFYVMGGYEHFKMDISECKSAGGGVGIEYKYYFLHRFYGVVNFHAGIYNEQIERYTPDRTTKADNEWHIREYKAGIGVGADLLQLDRHRLFAQATCGLAKIKQEDPVFLNYQPTETGTVSRHLTAGGTTSFSLGYTYNICSSVFVGFDYTGWWIPDYEYRNTLNARIGFAF